MRAIELLPMASNIFSLRSAKSLTEKSVRKWCFSWATEEEVINAEEILINDGKYAGWHSVDGVDAKGNICVTGKVQVYLRKR